MCAIIACQYTVGTSRRGDIVLQSWSPRKCSYRLFAYPLFKRAQFSTSSTVSKKRTFSKKLRPNLESRCLCIWISLTTHAPLIKEGKVRTLNYGGGPSKTTCCMVFFFEPRPPIRGEPPPESRGYHRGQNYYKNTLYKENLLVQSIL